MNESSPYASLFESVRIGPVVARNRFFQVAHCNGMGRAFPSAMAAMRGVKAEGGWAVVCTEQCDIHYSGSHQRELRLWDQRDVPYLARAAEQIHAHGALAAVELVHNGFAVTNLETRTVPLAPSCTPTRGFYPVVARSMDKHDIRSLRRWHCEAALNAKRAGFDIVYVYAGHDCSLPAHFLSRRHNRRTDEYGGSLVNRVRLMRELIEDTKAAIGDTCAVALRFGVDELRGVDGLSSEGEGREVVAMLAELPDLWDVNLSAFDNDGQTSRFSQEGFQERYVRFVKELTTKPVVGVGRFTNPDTMVRMVRGRILDFIGAARPSIADPFLPRKIAEGRLEDIRECIGCNMCAAYDKCSVPIICTQNPTMGEEWRRGWHPERIPRKDTNDRILVVGAGPAGLEAACALGQRGYDVLLVERQRELGGRVSLEARLPGLSEWARVRDWRIGQLRKLRNVQVILQSDVTVSDIRDAGVSLVALATGADWRRDGIGRAHRSAIAGIDAAAVFTPDDIMQGRLPQGRVLVFDDDHYYMANVIAEKLIESGCEVIYVTTESVIAAWTQMTSEQPRIQRRMLERCSAVHLSTSLAALETNTALLACVYTGRQTRVQIDALVLVTAMTPRTELHDALQALGERALGEVGIRRVSRVGDCFGPGTIAAAVYQGHAFARTLDTQLTDTTPFRRENVELDWSQAWPTGGFMGD